MERRLVLFELSESSLVVARFSLPNVNVFYACCLQCITFLLVSNAVSCSELPVVSHVINSCPFIFQGPFIIRNRNEPRSTPNPNSSLIPISIVVIFLRCLFHSPEKIPCATHVFMQLLVINIFFACCWSHHFHSSCQAELPVLPIASCPSMPGLEQSVPACPSSCLL